MAAATTESPLDDCGPGVTSSLACRLRLHPVERLCMTLKPPPFPGWLNESQLQHYKRDCSSWRAYEDICIHGRGSLRFGVETMTTPQMSPTTWIAPGIAFSASAILIVGTIITYIWHSRYKSKYSVERLQYRSYANGHTGPESSDLDPREKVETYSVTIISTGRVTDSVERGEHETNLDSEDDVKSSDIITDQDIMYETADKDPDIMFDKESDRMYDCAKDFNDSMYDLPEVTSSPDVSLDTDFSGIFKLPNVVPFQDVITHIDRSPDDCAPSRKFPKSESSEPIQLSSRVYEVGYVNPAYDGNDSLKEDKSPTRKKKRKSRLSFFERFSSSKH